MAVLRETLGARDAFIRSIVKDSSATLALSLRGLANNFCACLNKPVSAAFRAFFIGSRFHADAAIDGIITCFQKVLAALENDGDATKGVVVAERPDDSEVIELYLVFPF